jgi:hypothetical protein
MDINTELRKKQQEQWTSQFTLTAEQKKQLLQGKLDRMHLYRFVERERVKEDN